MKPALPKGYRWLRVGWKRPKGYMWHTGARFAKGGTMIVGVIISKEEMRICGPYIAPVRKGRKGE